MRRLFLALAAALAMAAAALAAAGEASSIHAAAQGVAADSSTAPLPPAKGKLLRPLNLAYRGEATILANTITFDLDRSIAKATVDGRNVWRIVSQQKTRVGVTVDTFDLDAKNLLPVRWAAFQPPARIVLQFGPSSVTGTTRYGPKETTMTAELVAPMYGDGAALEVLLGALPLKKGYTARMRVFDLPTRGFRVIRLRVTGLETVTVSAGRYECYRVELTGPERLPPSVVFVNAKKPRVMVRAHFELPPSAGGGFLDLDLASLK